MDKNLRFRVVFFYSFLKIYCMQNNIYENDFLAFDNNPS